MPFDAARLRCHDVTMLRCHSHSLQEAPPRPQATACGSDSATPSPAHHRTDTQTHGDTDTRPLSTLMHAGAIFEVPALAGPARILEPPLVPRAALAASSTLPGPVCAEAHRSRPSSTAIERPLKIARAVGALHLVQCTWGVLSPRRRESDSPACRIALRAGAGPRLQPPTPRVDTHACRWGARGLFSHSCKRAWLAWEACTTIHGPLMALVGAREGVCADG